MKIKNKKSLKFKIKIFLSVILFGVFVFIGIQAYMIAVSSKYIMELEDVPITDAVLILGASVYASGNPSPILKDRLEYGYSIYSAGKAKKIIVSGDHGTIEYDEVNTMRNYLLEKGVPIEDIFMDHAGFDTYDSAYRAKEIFGAKSIIISTQEYHMYRAVYAARKLGIEAYGVASPNKTIYNMPYNNFRECFARVKTMYDVHIAKRLPKYLGDKIPLSGDGRLTEG
jgi:vancomycin permeability regulator SanA